MQKAQLLVQQRASNLAVNWGCQWVPCWALNWEKHWAQHLGGKLGLALGAATGCLVLLGLALALGSKLSPNERSYLNKRSNLLVSATQQTLCPRHVETHKAYTERICISDSRKEFMKRTRLSRQQDKNSAVRLSVILLPSLDHQWFSQFDYEKQVAQPSQQLRTVEPASKS